MNGPMVLLVLAAAGSAPRDVDITSRTPAWVQASLGGTSAPFASSSELFALTSEILESNTMLAPLAYDAGAEARCLEKNEFADPLVCGVLAASEAEVQTLLRVGLRLREGERAVVVEALDVSEARARVEDALIGAGSKQERWDAAADAALASLRGRRATLGGAKEEVGTVIRQVVASELAELAPDRASRTATLELEVAPEGTEISLDERPLGLSGQAGVRVLGVPPGPHLLELRHRDRRPLDRAFELSAGQSLSLSLELSEDFSAGWQATAWAGGALLAGAAAVAVFGLVEDRPQPSNADLGLARFGGPSGLPALGGEVVGDGPLIAGLAASLAVSGCLLTVLGVLGEDEPRAPWWEIALGVGAGLVTYGAFELVNEAR